jgi:hypothetical protein
MNRTGIVIRILPLLIPALSVVVSAIIFIKLGCEGTGCMNATEWQAFQNSTQVQPSAVQQFINLFSIGGGP